MLGYVTQDGAGRADALMADVARRLAARGGVLATGGFHDAASKLLHGLNVLTSACTASSLEYGVHALHDLA